MQEIPQPDVLNPDRVVTDDREDLTAEEHRSRAQELDRALHASCAYAQQLWEQLDAARHYLQASLAPVGSGSAATSPDGPEDQQGWQAWMTVYADVTSILAGPHGDSDFGDREAQLEAQSRRSQGRS